MSQKNHPAAEPRDFLWEEFQKWLAYARVSQKKLDALLQDLSEFSQQLLQEKENEQRIAYFEKSIEELLRSCFSNLTRAEEIKIELWKGHSFESLGAWEKAVAAYQRVIDLSDSDELVPYQAEAQRWIGHIKLMQNRLSEALRALEGSLSLAKAAGDENNEAYAYNSLGYYYFELGELTQAASYWEKALELAEKIREVKFTAQVFNNLGALANVQGQWEKALASYGESAPRFEKIGEIRGLAETYHNMAMTYADAQRWAEAGTYYEKSHQLAKEIGDVRLQANVKLNRVELYLSIGDPNLAEALCRQALRTYVQLEDHLGEAEVYKFLGVIHTGRQDWSTSKSYFEKSIQIARKYRSPLCEAETHLEFGRMLKLKGNKKSARKQFEQALKLFTELRASKEIEKLNVEISEL